MYNVLFYVICTHIFGLSFQEKNPSFQLFTYLYLDTCFLYYKEILAFNFEHIMVQEILGGQGRGEQQGKRWDNCN